MLNELTVQRIQALLDMSVKDYDYAVAQAQVQAEASPLRLVKENRLILESYGYLETMRALNGWTKVLSEVDYLFMLIEEATVSPDDTWSGRGNDAQRSINDGRLKALKDVARTVKLEMKG